MVFSVIIGRRFYFFHCIKKWASQDEANISTIQTQAKNETWFSEAHADAARPECFEKATQKRTGALDARMITGNHRFRKAERLKGAQDFVSLIRNASSVREDRTVLYFARTDLRSSRLGVVVSKKVFKRATDRNRAKRLVREFFRLKKSRLSGNFDVVVKLTGTPNIKYRNELCLVLERLFQRSGLLPKD